MKKIILVSIVFGLFLVTVLSGCGGGGSTGGAGGGGLTAPTNLTVSGSSGVIALNWTAVSGATGYNVYRSNNGSSFTKINSALVTTINYSDTLDNTDKTLYHYYVKSVNGGSESVPSSTVRSMQGTRLNSTYAAGYTIGLGQWFVAEGTVEVTNGNLVVASGGELYVLDNTVIKLKAGTYSPDTCGKFIINGLLRVLAIPQAPATFTTTIASPPNGEGFALKFDFATNYNMITGTGTLLQNTNITNLRASDLALHITSCAPRLYNLKITSNQSTGGSSLEVGSGAGALIENCRFEKITPSFSNDLRGTTFKMQKNIFRGGYYSILFNNLNNPGVTSGQISSNDFDGSKNAALNSMTGGANVPLGGNYWNGGTGTPPKPNVITFGATTITYNFDTALSAPPADAGPTW